MSKIKSFLKNHPKILKLVFVFYNAFPFNNKIKGTKNNEVLVNGMMQHCRISFNGINNVVEIKDGAILKDCTLNISGNNNRIVFGERTYAHFADLCTEDNHNSILIGDRTSLCGRIHLAAIEGTTIEIGQNCLFSSDIVFRTGDSHSILNMDGERINPSKNIKICDHVWVGHRVLVNKGVTLGKNNIVGTGAVVTKSVNESNVVIAGVPAKVVKTDVNWDAERK